MVSGVRILILLVGLGLAGTGRAALLQLDLDQASTELGLPLRADLYAVDAERKIGDVDWDSLRDDFAVSLLDSGEDISDPRWPARRVQHVRARLYPRRTGTLNIAAIQLGDMTTSPRTVQVLPGSTVDGRIDVDVQVSSHQVWQRQQLLVSMTISTPDKFASLQTDPPGHDAAEIHVLPPTRVFNPDGGSTLRIGWSIFPLQSGAQTLFLPAVDYRLGGKVMRKYYLPPISIEVKPLPVYLSPTMPVGRVSIESLLDPGVLMQPGNLGYWHIRLTGEQVAPGWMPPVLRQVKAADDIQFLPSSTERDIAYSDNGIEAHVTHSLPFKLTANGATELPALEIQYFDPDSARLITVRSIAQPLWAINLAWRALLLVLVSVLVGWLGRHLHRMWRRWRQRRQCRRLALRQLAASHSAREICASLRLLGIALGWHGNLSMQAWRQHWQAKYRPDDELPALLAELSELGFARDTELRLDRLRSRLVEYLHRHA